MTVETQKGARQKTNGASLARPAKASARTLVCWSKNVPVHQAMPKTPTTPMRPERNTEPEANFADGTRQSMMMKKAVASITIWMMFGIGRSVVFSPTVQDGRRSETEPTRIETRMPSRKMQTARRANGASANFISVVECVASHW